MKPERSGSLETAQAVTEKAEEIKATEEKSVSSVYRERTEARDTARSDL